MAQDEVVYDYIGPYRVRCSCKWIVAIGHLYVQNIPTHFYRNKRIVQKNDIIGAKNPNRVNLAYFQCLSLSWRKQTVWVGTSAVFRTQSSA